MYVVNKAIIWLIADCKIQIQYYNVHITQNSLKNESRNYILFPNNL